MKKIKDINLIKLTEFRNEMMKILKEKFNKYQDSWKNVDIDYLLYKLKKQLNQINIDNPNRNCRRLLHVANYCYLIYQKLEGN